MARNKTTNPEQLLTHNIIVRVTEDDYLPIPAMLDHPVPCAIEYRFVLTIKKNQISLQ
jgi:hypothetical protein